METGSTNLGNQVVKKFRKRLKFPELITMNFITLLKVKS